MLNANVEITYNRLVTLENRTSMMAKAIMPVLNPGVNQLIVKEFTCSCKGMFCSIHPRDVRSNTCNIHPLVTPSAALQLKHRLHPHEGI